MPQKQHTEQIKCGLSTLDEIFNQKGINYRVLGSVLVAAINGEPHRTLGDIDILLDKANWPRISKDLEKEGYEIIKKRKAGFDRYEAHKDNCLGFTFLLLGKFEQDLFSYDINKFIKLTISNAYLQPTKYSLFGHSFIGVPPRSVYEELKISSLNPKRQLDKEVVAKAFGNRIPNGESLSQAFKIYIAGRQIPYAYPFFSGIYNLYGGLRVLFGKKYEIWD